MKKISMILLLSLICALGFFSGKAEASSTGPASIVINDELIKFKDVKPFMSNNVTYVPIRLFSQSLGVDVNWDQQKQIAILTKASRKLSLDLKQNMIITESGGKQKVSLHLVNNQMVAPYRFIGEYFGYQVEYVQKGSFARITDKNAKLTNEQIYEKYKKELTKTTTKPGKVAYLTFDDGPNAHTERILNILKKYDAKATFFMLNDNMAAHQTVVKEMVSEGHGVGCHGVTHDQQKFYRSPASAVGEMNTCLSTLAKITGQHSTVIRVPYGSKPYMTTNYRKAMDAKGYQMWDWNVDSLDWKLLNGPKTANYTINQIKALQKSGTSPLILFHDKATTADALPAVLSYLKENGYELLPITNDIEAYNFWDRRKI
ncbi:polysaccharide deacetylase family protein [Heyndrickxia sp. FSL K6-6286]|uniref:polysaccharide deacetylase family protein n=1 Tax=Heyndrickxia sp. FSL K6-6286 TaxID=2921510 RepID=UPI0007172541